METTSLRDKVFKELCLIPEEKLPEILDFLHHFRVGTQIFKSKAERRTDFSGCWQDMPDEIYRDFVDEVALRRHSAFSGRQNREEGAD